jgi:hypothetical protein
VTYLANLSLVISCAGKMLLTLSPGLVVWLTIVRLTRRHL